MADEEARGFLGRWARRKTDALQGKPLDEPVASVAPPKAPEVSGVRPSSPVSLESAPAPADATMQPEKKLLTLEDVKLLTKDSDFKPFMASDVGPDVRNAAMKKLFADPHFNVMDGLDIYIDDYSKPDPIPESMLRQMVGARLLHLFDDEDKEKKADQVSSPRESANNPTDETMAQSYENPAISDPAHPSDPSSQPEFPSDSGASHEKHAHTDLRLQPDNAPPAPDTGRGT